MATHDGGGSRSYHNLDSESDSGSSFHSSNASSALDPVCRWRNARFYGQECSRYFDCPSHIVERRLSGDDASDGGPPRNPDGASSPGETNDASDDSNSAGSEASSRALPGSPTGSSAHNPIDLSSTVDDVPAVPAPAATTSMTESAMAPAGAAPPEREIIDLTSSPAAAPPPLPAPASPSGPSGTAAEGGSNQAAPAQSSSPASPLAPRGGESPPPRRPTPPPPPAAVRRRTSTNTATQRASEQSAASRRQPSEVVLPRWQPDAEVTFCPICHTQFSIFVRKHHCRKCGRVVCNSCSPHRIVIPYQYIVQPPGGYADFSSLGGGERVRLCNPCVPDPNTTPPQAHGSGGQRGHSRSQSTASTLGSPTAPPSGRFSSQYGSMPADPYARNRSITVHAGEAGSSGRMAAGNRPYQSSTQSRIMAGTPPTYHPYPSAASQSSASTTRYRSMLDVGPSSAAQTRPLPPAPPQIAEEDECPVCHRELPERSLPNFEALREAHITICITAHSTYGSTPSHGDSSRAPGASAPPRRTGMFPYKATEKDCVDSAECTICLEEFEVGVPMARLECLCRFHRACISAWFVNHPGRCPVHQHDSYGY